MADTNTNTVRAPYVPTNTYQNVDPGQNPVFAMGEAPARPTPPRPADIPAGPVAQNAQNAQPAQPVYAMPPAVRVKEEKGRRVGTFTMAFCLIIAGGLLVAHIFVPGLDLLAIAKFAPLILVALGCEILITALLNDGKKMRYDFLSMLVCIMLIGGSGVATLGGIVYQHETTTRTAEARLESELNARTAEALSGKVGLGYYVDNWNIYLPDNADLDYTGMSLADVPAFANTTLDFTFEQDFAGVKDFTKAARDYLAAMNGVAPHIDRAYLTNHIEVGTPQDGDTYYELNVSGLNNMALSAAQLESFVTTYVYLQDNGWMDEESYEQIQANMYEVTDGEAGTPPDGDVTAAEEVETPAPPAIPEDAEMAA